MYSPPSPLRPISSLVAEASNSEPKRPKIENDEDRFTLSMETIRLLKCSFCDCYLTVAPITITSLNGTEWKCGRCTFVVSEYSVPALLFETIAMGMTFPCAYPSCAAVLPWEGTKAHESTCPHRPMRCPCGEQVEFGQALFHFRHDHPDIISTNQAIVPNPDYCKLLTRLVMMGDVPFMLYILCERKSEIRVGVYCLQDEPDTYEAQVKLTTTSNNSSIVLPKKRIPTFDSRIHCADCLLKTCKTRYHRYFEANRKPPNEHVYDMMTVRINTLSVLNVLNSDTFVLTVGVSEEGESASQEVAFERNEQLRKSWECQICHEYLVGAIYICPTGHSLCGACKTALPNCPFCVTAVSDARNFKLEEMAECVELACQHERRGCNYVGTVAEVATHERKCPWAEAREAAAAAAMPERRRRKKHRHTLFNPEYILEEITFENLLY